MSAAQTLSELARLYTLEVEATQAYATGVRAVGLGPIQEELTRFWLEHQKHVLELHLALLGRGHRVPEVEPDVKGVVIGALTPPSRTPTTEEVLEAMRGNEQLTGSVYAKALAKPFPKGVLEFLVKARADERQHLEWVERAISRRLWEHADVAHP